MQIEAFYDPATYTLTYVVYDPASRDAVVIDPVLDYDPLSSQVATRSVEKVAEFVEKQRLTLHYVLETHAHADHLSGSQYLKRRFDARVAVGARITEVQATFKPLFDLGPEFMPDGTQFDVLLADGTKLAAGTLVIETIATPGHTPACVSYAVGDAVFTGDALFIEDSGTGRCDFPRGSADELYTSVHDRLYALPDATRVYVGHDYQPNGRPLRFATTIGKSKEGNIQLRASTTRDEFVRARNARDATLTPPRLLYPSVQVNVNAGRLPRPHANGIRYLTVPLSAKQPLDDDGTPATHARKTVLFEDAKRNVAGYRDIDPLLVHQGLGRVRIVDVREPAEFTGELGHVPGAELAPLATIERAAAQLDKNEEVVVVCRSGGRSARAAAALVEMGFSRVMNMVGGMLAWNGHALATQR